MNCPPNQLPSINYHAINYPPNQPPKSTTLPINYPPIRYSPHTQFVSCALCRKKREENIAQLMTAFLSSPNIATNRKKIATSTKTVAFLDEWSGFFRWCAREFAVRICEIDFILPLGLLTLVLGFLISIQLIIPPFWISKTGFGLFHRHCDV